MSEDFYLNEEPEEEKELELQMVIYPNPGLHEKAAGFTEEELQKPEVREVIEAMPRTMYKYAGIGLAAQQVGIPYAVFVLDVDWPTYGTQEPKTFINPVIKEYGGGVVSLNPPGEGCLSTPYNFRAQVQRSEKIKIEWRDIDWGLHEEWFDGVEAIAIQHEIDHLHGFLFVDRISRLKRDIFERKVKKTRRHYLKGVKQVKKMVKMEVAKKKRGRKRD
jgi:peptide deformylase